MSNVGRILMKINAVVVQEDFYWATIFISTAHSFQQRALQSKILFDKNSNQKTACDDSYE